MFLDANCLFSLVIMFCSWVLQHSSYDNLEIRSSYRAVKIQAASSLVIVPNIFAMKRSYQQSSSSASLGPPKSKSRHNPDGENYSYLLFIVLLWFTSWSQCSFIFNSVWIIGVNWPLETVNKVNLSALKEEMLYFIIRWCFFRGWEHKDFCQESCWSLQCKDKPNVGGTRSQSHYTFKEAQ